MQKDISGPHGIRWGIIIGVVYSVLLFLRFYMGAHNAAFFGFITFTGFITVIVLLFFCGHSFRKRAGGFAEMKEIFKTMFIAVLIFELCYSLFSLIYLKYIDPGFLKNSS